MCSLTVPLEGGEVGWLRRMSPPVLDPAVRAEECWQRLEGGSLLSSPSVLEPVVCSSRMVLQGLAALLAQGEEGDAASLGWWRQLSPRVPA